LSRELISGQIQVGNSRVVTAPGGAAQIPAAGDGDNNPNTPTYATIARVTSLNPAQNAQTNRGSAVVTETIFAWPGSGRMFFNALGQSDIALLMGYLLVLATLVVFSNLLADVTYAWLDPRVKYD